MAGADRKRNQNWCPLRPTRPTFVLRDPRVPNKLNLKETNIRYVGYYSVHFSYSPISTNWIYTMELVLHYQTNDVSISKIPLKKELDLSFIYSCLLEVQVST